MRTEFLDKPLKMPSTYRGFARNDYRGGCVHVLQIGLGTFGTFVQRDVTWMNTLLEATTLQYGESVRGIGVDPLEESAGTLEALALRECPEASILLAAVGEMSGTASLFCLPKGTRLHIRKKLRNQRVNM